MVYSYDPVGHVEKHTYRAAGSSVAMVQPMLDNQVGICATLNKKYTNEDFLYLVRIISKQ